MTFIFERIYLTSLQIFKFNFVNYIKMPGKTAIERVKENAELTKRTIAELRNELNVINKEYNIILAKQLQDENIKLMAAVQEAKNKLIQLEVQDGIKQVPIPAQGNSILSTSETQPVDSEPPKSTSEQIRLSVSKEKPKKEKKEKKTKELKEIPSEGPVDVGRLDLRIGKIEEVQRHPDADTLYLLKINCGEDKLRTVCSGLVKYVPIEDLQNRSVILLCNLKPVKMRGINSEAMVMCASSEAGVEVLSPPDGSLPGELVQCEGYIRQPDQPFMNPKKKIFETIAPDLHTNDKLEACYKNVPFNVPGKGVCLAKSLKNVPVK